MGGKVRLSPRKTRNNSTHIVRNSRKRHNELQRQRRHEKNSKSAAHFHNENYDPNCKVIDDLVQCMATFSKVSSSNQLDNTFPAETVHHKAAATFRGIVLICVQSENAIPELALQPLWVAKGGGHHISLFESMQSIWLLSATGLNIDFDAFMINETCIGVSGEFKKQRAPNVFEKAASILFENNMHRVHFMAP